MGKPAAIFDFDGTLIDSNIIHYYLFFIKHLPWYRRWWRYLKVAILVPYWFFLDRKDRMAFNRSFYASYRGLSEGMITSLSEACYERFQKTRLNREIVERLVQHQKVGDRVIVISGSLDFVLRPLAEKWGVDACLCPRLNVHQGVYDGSLKGQPVIGEEKARLLLDYSRENDIDLGSSYAYADGISDVPLLSLVGHPVAARPDQKLKEWADREHCEIIEKA